jgi:uncharacterized protein YndB with AHSA1/START domain
MSRNVAIIDAPAAAVFAVLSDARRYPDWVVGASRLRTVDADFPAPGTAFGHKLGLFWPFQFNDETKVVRNEPGRRLTLRAEIGVFGAATVDLQLEEFDDDRTRVVLEETPAMGPLRWFHNPAQDAAFWLRNWLSLACLRWIAEGNAGPPKPPTGEPE